MSRKLALLLLTLVVSFIALLPLRDGRIENVRAADLGGKSESGGVGGESAPSVEEQQKEMEELEKKISEYEKKIADLQEEERTLQNEIQYMDSQIYLTTLKIKDNEEKLAAKERELAGLREDIGGLQDRIVRLGELLDEQQRIFGARARESYKSSHITTFEIVFGAPNLARLVERIKYLQVLELQSQRLLAQMEKTREDCAEQKKLLEDKKAEVEQIKAEIESYKASLESQRASLTRQKKDKEDLLAVTRGKESDYQRLLEQVRSELASIAAALEGGVKIGEVKKGDIIAYEGNTGCVCSSIYGCAPPPKSDPTAGSHLHFGVYKDGKAVNPRDYLGDELAWPEKNPTVTQEFGENYSFYMRNFGIPGHNGLDMTAGYGSPIRAAADGVAYATGDDRVWASWCNGKAKGVRIDHGNGLQTIYWHVL